MGTVATDGRDRGGASSLREQHHALTRELILRSVADQLEAGRLSDLTIPEVAKAAGVSVRTLYRHFATREELIAAASEWIAGHFWADPTFPERVEDIPAHFASQATSFDQHPNLVRVMAISRAGSELRSVRRAQRLESQNQALREVTGNLPPAEQRRAEAVFGYLSSMMAWLTMRDENGFSGEESGAAVAWAMQTLIDDLRRRNEAAGNAAKRTPRTKRTGR
jgi:AcrR family transcriptional regulator